MKQKKIDREKLKQTTHAILTAESVVLPSWKEKIKKAKGTPNAEKIVDAYLNALADEFLKDDTKEEVREDFKTLAVAIFRAIGVTFPKWEERLIAAPSNSPEAYKVMEGYLNAIVDEMIKEAELNDQKK